MQLIPLFGVIRFIFHKDHNEPPDQKPHHKMIGDRSKCDR